MGKVVALHSNRISLGYLVDDLIARVEDGGLTAYVMQGERGLILAFEHAGVPRSGDALGRAVTACRLFATLLREDEALQHRVTETALAEGSCRSA